MKKFRTPRRLKKELTKRNIIIRCRGNRLEFISLEYPVWHFIYSYYSKNNKVLEESFAEYDY